jgi:hypothetical protein
MVNWREDVEFVYGLFMLISCIVVFFILYDSVGLTLAAVVTVVVALVEVGIAFAAFESDRAIASWERLGKKEPMGEKK